jgi:hypothetical protein
MKTFGGRVVSYVRDAFGTETRDIDVRKVLEAIRNGDKLKEPIQQIRSKFEAELAANGGDLKKAKRSIESLKKALPGVILTGRYANRELPVDEKLLEHSGLFVGDMDDLGPELVRVREQLRSSPHVAVMFRSPNGRGLKLVVCVPADASTHRASFRAVEKHVRELTGFGIDKSGKDIGRLCFMSWDPELYYNPNATEIEPCPEPEKPEPAVPLNSEINLSERQRIASEIMARYDCPVRWLSDSKGRALHCPGEHLHTAGDKPRDCDVDLDGAPTVHCFHTSCRGILGGINYELRSRIGKAEFEKAPKSAATQLVQLAEGFEFFHDRQDRPFVRLEDDGHIEVWPVESAKFRKVLARLFHKKTGSAINRNAIGDAVTTLAGKACFDGAEEPVFLRVAWYGEHILIDLCDDGWRVVEVTPRGWKILDHSPVAFIRTGSMQSLPFPVKGSGSIAPLWKLLNVTTAQRPLVAGALLNAFHPDGPYFVLNYVGEQGTAKTYGARITRQLFDPNANPLRSPPKEERDLIAQAANNWCVAFDNLSSLPPWQSDGLCRLSTGGGHSARTLYTDLEEISLAVKRPVILNGIEDVAERPDLAERSLQIELEEIPHKKRMTEKVLDQIFAEQRSVIFSGILDALVCALREQPKIKLDSLPRMADAALWATAGETAFGWKRGTFIAAYTKNLDESAIASVEAHPVGVAILALLEKEDQWSGTAAELLETLNATLSEEARQVQNWPKNVRSLGHALRRLAPALRRAGFDYKRERSEHRIIYLSKRCKVAEKTSRTSRTSIAKEKPGFDTSSKNVDTSSEKTTSSTTSGFPQVVDDVDDVDVLSGCLHVVPPEPDPTQKTDDQPKTVDQNPPPKLRL